MRSFALLYAALHDFGFALFHLGFARIFRWRTALAGLDPINRGIVPALNDTLTFVLAGGAALVLWIWARGVHDATATLVLVGFGATWLFRGALQPIHWGVREPVSFGFLLLFLAGGAAHLAGALLP